MFQPDRLEFKPSSALVILISAAHLVAALALLLASLPALLYFIVLLLLLISWIQLLRRFAWLSHPQSPVYLRWDHNGWYAALRVEPESEYQVRPGDGCRLWPVVDLLCFHPLDPAQGKSFSQLVLSDSDNRRPIRRLRVLLKLRGSSHS
ncbi:protein YgfX [Motiliproteus coralliicola]|uniref:protein YgfX n=1 Tax=Motiliproteus coralliicola TaxID=2283196 RepID=UPI0010588A75|nr:protein YgfX [Motiliproteus coralliicola]